MSVTEINPPDTAGKAWRRAVHEARPWHDRGLETILAEVCSIRRVHRTEVLSGRKVPRYLQARWVCWARSRDRGYTTTRIGTFYGVDASTISHGSRRWLGWKKHRTYVPRGHLHLAALSAAVFDAP